MNRERLILAALLLASLTVRAIRTDQPIVENYVGRQVPTAMVARNLDRGSGFLHPTLDTGPFPNEFLVEPPIYASLVSIVHQTTGLGWEASGRLTSAVATTLGGWAFFGLLRRRSGPLVALIALAAFGAFPVIVRYGRAFQPDALMLGLVLIGLRSWDEWQATGHRRWAWYGGLILSTGLAVKVTASWTLIPFFLLARRWPPAFRVFAGLAMLVPAFAWYVHAWGQVHPSAPVGVDRAGSLASADNAAIWIRTLDPSAWLRLSTWDAIGRNLLHRAFTAVGIGLALYGWIRHRAQTSNTKRSQSLASNSPDHPNTKRTQGSAAEQGPSPDTKRTQSQETKQTQSQTRERSQSADTKRTQPPSPDPQQPADTKRTQSLTPEPQQLADTKRTQSDRLWLGWVIGGGLAVIALGAKWHHGYYWMVFAPPVAVGVALALVPGSGEGRVGRWVRSGLGLVLLGACVGQSVGTYAAPIEWASIASDGRRIAAIVPEGALLIAPEAVLYQADRRGMRMEFEPAAARRAAGEWGGNLPIDALERDPLALVDFYDRVQVTRPGGGNEIYPERAGYFADVGPATDDPRRLACRDALRSRNPSGVLIDEPRLFLVRLGGVAPQ